MKTFGFALIGCGGIANIHKEAIKNITNAKLVGVFDANQSKAISFAKENEARAYLSLEELLHDPMVDIVNICTPSGLHAQYIIEAAKAKKNIVVEKPMVIKEEEIREVQRVIKENGVKIEVVSQLRFTESIRRIKEAIDNNELGNIKNVNYIMNYYRDEEYYSSSGWRGTWKMDGGGALMNQGIHGIDLIQYLVGDVASLDAKCETVMHHIEVEDSALINLTFKNGATGYYNCNTISKPGYPRRIEFIGEKGRIILEEDTIIEWNVNYKSDITSNESKLETSKNFLALPYEYHKLQFEDLIDSIINNRKPIVDEYEGAKAVRIILAAYQSSREKKRVILNEN